MKYLYSNSNSFCTGQHESNEETNINAKIRRFNENLNCCRNP